MKRCSHWLVAILVVMSCISIAGATCVASTSNTYYISTGGKDSNSGSIGSPWRTIAHAVDQVPDRSSTIVVRDGVYDECVFISRRFESSLLIKAEHPYRVRWQCDEPSQILKIGRAKNITVQGFEFTRPGLSEDHQWFVVVWWGGDTWSENITLRDNIFHDSVNNDLLRIGTGVSNIIVEGNVFYNQASVGGEHIDVNGVVGAIVQDNIFFNDFAGSGRVDHEDTNSYIVIKDSAGTKDGVIGARNIIVRRNVFLNWEGAMRSFVMVGEDSISTFEAVGVTIENNLMLGNSPNPLSSPITVRGSKDVTVRANTIVGDCPGRYFVIDSFITGDNPKNENIRIHNNIWSDPTGTMGDQFSCCDPSQTTSFTFDNNLFFNKGNPFPDSNDPFVEITDDVHRVIGDPKLGDQGGGITVPRWNGTGFDGGYGTIREAFEGLVDRYGALGFGSAAIHRADPAHMPADDILGNERSNVDDAPDIGAYEAVGFGLAIEPIFHHIDPGESADYAIHVEPGIATGSVSISISADGIPPNITWDLAPTTVSMPGVAGLTLTSTHDPESLAQGVFAHVTITVTGSGFTRTKQATLLVGGTSLYLPAILKQSFQA
jgi:hypothetical protein